ERAPWPLPLWLYPAQRLDDPQPASMEDGEEEEGGGRKPPTEQGQAPRTRGDREDVNRGKGGLALVRRGHLFSWSEHVGLDRCGDDTEDLDAARVAEDLDHLSVSRKRSSKGGGLKLDLDLPAAENDDVPFGEGIRLPEWDYRKQALVEDYVL